LRDDEGRPFGIIWTGESKFYTKPYAELVAEVISSNEPTLFKNFILTIGMVSNHGNWFTSDNPNKEMKVLADSYDWLIFLTDRGIQEFITNLLLEPSNRYQSIRKAFLSSYQGDGRNQFTKVAMNYEAHIALLNFFKGNSPGIEHWFNIITPRDSTLGDLRSQLESLASKNWRLAQ
jgi:hypothetical protein